MQHHFFVRSFILHILCLVYLLCTPTFGVCADELKRDAVQSKVVGAVQIYGFKTELEQTKIPSQVDAILSKIELALPLILKDEKAQQGFFDGTQTGIFEGGDPTDPVLRSDDLRSLAKTLISVSEQSLKAKNFVQAKRSLVLALRLAMIPVTMPLPATIETGGKTYPGDVFYEFTLVPPHLTLLEAYSMLRRNNSSFQTESFSKLNQHFGEVRVLSRALFQERTKMQDAGKANESELKLTPAYLQMIKDERKMYAEQLPKLIRTVEEVFDAEVAGQNRTDDTK